MRLFAIVLLCLVLATCASHIPSARVTHPANAGLPGLQASLAYSFNQCFYQNRFQFTQGNIIQKKQGLSSVYQNIIYTHGNQVNSYAIMNSYQLGNF